ncbi:MAG: MarR family transcriptional regulator [Armatimonadetes bacterium]|nr:MarR family transcriptional regulator [Armatimonadota bacterium]
MLERYAEEILATIPEIVRLLSTQKQFEVDDLKLTLGQMRVLFELPQEDSISMGALSQALGISMPAATDVVDRLVRDGLVCRKSDPKDRRVVRVALTQPGAQVKSKCYCTKRQHWLSVLERLTPAERKRMVDHLVAFRRLLQKASDRDSTALPSEEAPNG